MHELTKRESSNRGSPGHCRLYRSGDALLRLCQCMQRVVILKPYAATAEPQCADAFEVVQLAIDDFAGGADRKGNVIIRHFDGRSFATRPVEFSDQQVQ